MLEHWFWALCFVIALIVAITFIMREVTKDQRDVRRRNQAHPWRRRFRD